MDFFQRNRPHPDNRPDQRMLLRLFAAGSALLRHICGDNRSHFASFADGSAVSALRTRLFCRTGRHRQKIGHSVGVNFARRRRSVPFAGN